MKVEIKQISPANKDVRELFRLLDAHNLSYCSAEVCHLIQPEELEELNSTLLGIFCNGTLCGMGGLKFIENYAELTRMFIKEEYRGKGLAVKLLQELEAKALEKGLDVLKLETSEKFVQAFKVYQKYGFKRCLPFGEYIDKPYNTYMEKDIKTSS